MDQWTEDMVVERAAELYRAWEARPWHERLKGRVRGAWRRWRYTLRLY